MRQLLHNVRRQLQQPTGSVARKTSDSRSDLQRKRIGLPLAFTWQEAFDFLTVATVVSALDAPSFRSRAANKDVTSEHFRAAALQRQRTRFLQCQASGDG